MFVFLRLRAVSLMVSFPVASASLQDHGLNLLHGKKKHFPAGD